MKKSVFEALLKQTCVCVFLHVLHIKEIKLNFTFKVRTFVGGEDILSGPHIFKVVFEEFRLGGLGSCWVHAIYESPHKVLKVTFCDPKARRMSCDLTPLSQSDLERSW